MGAGLRAGGLEGGLRSKRSRQRINQTPPNNPTQTNNTKQSPRKQQVARDIAAAFSLPPTKVVHVKDRAFNDRRYYIGSDKLAALGWRETTSWEDGLKRTIDWYLATDCGDYWQGDLEAALRPHPLMVGASLTSDPTRIPL